MRKTSSGTPVFFSDEKLLKHIREKQGMQYRDEHYGESKICYDGKLLPLKDASTRLKYDRARQSMYEWAEDKVDENQLTWDEVKESL